MPVRVGVVSDTHGLFDPRLREVLAGVDLILHGGDVGQPHILVELSRLAPVVAVRGNVDVGVEGLDQLPEAVTVAVDGVAIYVTHILQPPRTGQTGDPVPAGTRVAVFGHSHLPHLDEAPGPLGAPVLWFNPAAAGPQRFGNPRLVGLLTVADGVPRAEHLRLD